MGVKGLWRVMADSGTPVSLESLEGKVLAVDVSIWLHQAIHGYRGAGGSSVANSHLLIMFHRICKLLFYRIRPIFIFDGSIPHFKKQTMASRKLRQEVATSNVRKIRERLLANLLKSQVVRNALGKKGPAPSLHRVPKPVKKENDLFELMPIAADSDISKCAESEDNDHYVKSSVQNLHNFDLDNKDFQTMSIYSKHEVLFQMQDTRKQNTWNAVETMPQDSTDFAKFQMERLRKRQRFQETLDDVRNKIQKKHSAEMEARLLGDLENYVSQTKKISSEDAAHSIFLKKVETNTPKKKPVVPDRVTTRVHKKDFLTELAKAGLIKDKSEGIIESDSDFSDNETADKHESRENLKLEEDSFIEAMDYVLDDSDITQDEIMAVIEQTKNETHASKQMKTFDINEPSTSRSHVPVQDTSSLSEDEYCQNIEDDADFSSSQPGTGENIKAILGAKTNSLYLKIVQQKLDDIISSGDKIVTTDSRKLGHRSKIVLSPNDEAVAMASGTTVNDSLSPKCSPKETISISFDTTQHRNSFEDDIFRDIFPSSKPAAKNSFQTNPKNSHNMKGDSINKSKSKLENTPPKNIESLQFVVSPELKNKVNELVKLEIETIVRKEKETQLSNCQSKTENTCKLQLEMRGQRNPSPFADNQSEDPDILSDRTDSSGFITDEEFNNEKDQNVVDRDYDFVSEIKSINKDLGITGSKLNQSFDVDSGDLENYGSIATKTVKIIDNTNKNVTEDVLSINKLPSVNDKGTDEAEDYISDSDSNSMTDEHRSVAEDKLLNDSEEDDSTKYLRDQTQILENNISNEELNQIETKLVSENEEIVLKANKMERLASSITNQMYTDAQELLRLFGLPYLVAPSEAEAQCAFLEMAKLSEGTITDDSDIFLFGGDRVYKNFFNQTKHVEMFNIDNVERQVGLNREKMIELALLTGSDYTAGIQSIGGVLAMEILSEFPGKGIECLKNLKLWWDSAQKGKYLSNSKIKQRLSALYFPEAFPNNNIYNAYLNPDVDESNEKFSWAIPHEDELRVFAIQKFGWSLSKTEEILTPLLKKMNINLSQRRLDSYFDVKLLKYHRHQSQRMKDAISRVKGEEPEQRDILFQTKRKRKDVLSNTKKKRSLELNENPDVADKIIEPTPGPPRIPRIEADALHPKPSLILSKAQKREVNYQKIHLSEGIRNTQAEQDRKRMENRKKIAAEILKKCKKTK